MSLHFRSGVDLRQMTTQILLAWEVAAEVFERHGRVAWVTSLYRPGTWSQTLLHGKGSAIDIGLRLPSGDVIDDPTIDAIVADLRTRLDRRHGGQFDVVDERTAPGGPHVHVEWDPR